MNLILKNTLTLCENTAFLYMHYIEEYNTQWSVDEKKHAEEMLGSLTLYCHQIKEIMNAVKNKEVAEIDKESLDFINGFIPRIEFICHHIDDSLKEHVVFSN